MKYSKCSPTQLVLGFLLLGLLTIGSGCSDSSSTESSGEKESGILRGNVKLWFELPEDSATLAGTRVSAEGTNYSALTDASGEFALSLPSGTYTLVFHHDGFDDSKLPNYQFVAPGEARLFYPDVKSFSLTQTPSFEMSDLEWKGYQQSSILFSFKYNNPRSAPMVVGIMPVIAYVISDRDLTKGQMPDDSHIYYSQSSTNYDTVARTALSGINGQDLKRYFSSGTTLYVYVQPYHVGDRRNYYLDTDGRYKFSLNGKKSNIISFTLQ